MKTAALFPFNRCSLPVVRHFNEFQDRYELIELIAMPGTGLAGKDAGVSCNQPGLGFSVTDQLETEKSEWEILFIVREFLPIGYDLENTIQRLLSCGKKVIVLEHSYKSIPKWLIEMNDNEDDLDIFCNEVLWKHDGKINGYEKVNTPVILIGGIIEEADVFEITTTVTKALKDTGLCVATITKEAVAQIFGFMDFKSLYSGHEDPFEKINNLNIAIRMVEKNLVPDIIVIEAPDAIIRYNDIAPNGFGICTYMLCQAVAVDTLICCMPYDLAQEGFIRLVSEDFKIRYGTGIGMVHASNVLVDSIELLNHKQLTYFYDSLSRMEDFIANHVGEAEVPVLNMIVNSDRVRECLNKLLFGQEGEKHG